MTDETRDITAVNAPTAREWILAEGDAEQLARWHTQERAHPRFPGGRDSVITAIDARLQTLEATPRGPVEDAEPSALASARPWTEGSWAGLTQYRCRHCRYETLEPTDIEAHVRQAHGFLLEPRPSAPPVPETQPAEPWTEGSWSGLAQYNCSYCRYQTLDRGEIERHAAAAHPLEWRRHLKRKEPSNA